MGWGGAQGPSQRSWGAGARIGPGPEGTESWEGAGKGRDLGCPCCHMENALEKERLEREGGRKAVELALGGSRASGEQTRSRALWAGDSPLLVASPCGNEREKEARPASSGPQIPTPQRCPPSSTGPAEWVPSSNSRGAGDAPHQCLAIHSTPLHCTPVQGTGTPLFAT